MSAFRRPNAKGRSTGALSGRDRKLRSPPQGEPWFWLTAALLASDAVRALSPNGRRFIDFLCLEHTNHAGQENGHLIATYQQLTDYGLSRRLIREAICECVYFGLVRVEQRGRLSSGGFKHPSRYRLTFYVSKEGGPATNEWKAITQDKVEKWKHARKQMRKTGISPGVAINTTPPPGRL